MSALKPIPVVLQNNPVFLLREDKSGFKLPRAPTAQGPTRLPGVLPLPLGQHHIFPPLPSCLSPFPRQAPFSLGNPRGFLPPLETTSPARDFAATHSPSRSGGCAAADPPTHSNSSGTLGPRRREEPGETRGGRPRRPAQHGMPCRRLYSRLSSGAGA